ncbi:uncharacterized protein F5Z01DRAFT_535508 [Emericellopsis atlantica]|uniref:Uncharacterized protein n=1 Tax=Emericellopsis atlantica TaxID=2614577 RepID=A0A9P7ZQL8_9HYPO|nr:uncharacterized protein F5Z01DRAFT_535508 [Emericellopsis atlantica]KAG9256041.1 hypothetical protein F5Z01DRAFT_535508 [Emericellopsis atlantica]
MSQAPRPQKYPPYFAEIKQRLVEGHQDAVCKSWHRLLCRLRTEVDLLAREGSNSIPTISFNDIANESTTRQFVAVLKQRGVGVVRNVVAGEALSTWMRETEQYFVHSMNEAIGASTVCGSQLQNVFWSPAQTRARVSPGVLVVQQAIMRAWTSPKPQPPLTTNFPVVYADRLHRGDATTATLHQTAHIDGPSLERWGQHSDSPYAHIWRGDWERYDPWDPQSRLAATTELRGYDTACSMFRMFQGLLCLGTPSSEAVFFRFCPLLQAATAYVLLRPFFSPVVATPSSPDFLFAENWIFAPAACPELPGAGQAARQEVAHALHPHLQLSQTLIQHPPLRPGDYLIWHPDAIIAPPEVASNATAMFLPACPLTHSNALYLARQRKTFLLGHRGPDFAKLNGRDERAHMGRAGVQDVCDAGGEAGLRAMGLMPWDEDDVESAIEAEVVDMANNVLFPDRHDFDMMN